MKSILSLLAVLTFCSLQLPLHAGKLQNKELIRAAKDGSVRRVEHALKEAFLKDAAEIDYQDKNGQTALFWATERNRVSVVQLLLEKGACVDLCSKSGRTPLSRALEKIAAGEEEGEKTKAIILLLANKGADKPDDSRLKKLLNKILEEERVFQKKTQAAIKIQSAFRGHHVREQLRNDHSFTVKNETGEDILFTLTAHPSRVPNPKTAKGRAKKNIVNYPILLKAGQSWTSWFLDPVNESMFSPCLAATVYAYSPASLYETKTVSTSSRVISSGAFAGARVSGSASARVTTAAKPYLRKFVNRDLPRDTVVTLKTKPSPAPQR